MTDDGNEWIPLRQAVAEVATVYHEALKGDYEKAREQAIEAIHHRLEMSWMGARSIGWGLRFDEGGVRVDERGSPLGTQTEIDGGFWTCLDTATEARRNDWISGEFIFHRIWTLKNDTGPFEQLVLGWAMEVEVTRRGMPFSPYFSPKDPEQAMLNLARRRGRPEGSGGFGAHDMPIVAKMREMIEVTPGLTAFGAAGHFAGEAAGTGGFEAKQRRLAKVYRKLYEN